jgi:hypothetical protein
MQMEYTLLLLVDELIFCFYLNAFPFSQQGHFCYHKGHNRSQISENCHIVGMKHLQIGWHTRVKMCCILHGPSCYHCRHVQNTVQYSPSIDIRPEWTVLEQVQVPLLTKLSLRVEEPNDYMQCGIVSYYEKKIDRVAPRSLVPLVKTNSVFRSVTASEDPILVQIAKERKAKVFITDSILTALMCTPRSVYSWDIVITRKGDQLWFDKRSDSVLDKESVNETAPDGVPEDDSINGVAQLAMEATAVRQNFSQQCLDIAQSYDLGQPNPFATVRASLCAKFLCLLRSLHA